MEILGQLCVYINITKQSVGCLLKHTKRFNLRFVLWKPVQMQLLHTIQYNTIKIFSEILWIWTFDNFFCETIWKNTKEKMHSSFRKKYGWKTLICEGYSEPISITAKEIINVLRLIFFFEETTNLRLKHLHIALIQYTVYLHSTPYIFHNNFNVTRQIISFRREKSSRT